MSTPGESSTTRPPPVVEEEEEEEEEEEDIRMLDAPRVRVNNSVTVNRLIKIANPPTFLGNAIELNTYIAKLKLYISYNHEFFPREVDKVIFAISYLEGSAFN